MFDSINDQGKNALVMAPIPNLLRMLENLYRANLQDQMLTKGSQLLALGEQELRQSVGNFVRWGINSNATACVALNANPVPERRFPQGMQSQNCHNMYALALMFANLLGLEDDLQAFENPDADAKPASQDPTDNREGGHRGGKRQRNA
jgi:hypothetical protein